MPLIRKVIQVGKTSRGVILPKSWLKYYEKKAGKRIENVAIEVNKVLIIKPIFENGTSPNEGVKAQNLEEVVLEDKE